MFLGYENNLEIFGSNEDLCSFFEDSGGKLDLGCDIIDEEIGKGSYVCSFLSLEVLDGWLGEKAGSYLGLEFQLDYINRAKNIEGTIVYKNGKLYHHSVEMYDDMVLEMIDRIRKDDICRVMKELDDKSSLSYNMVKEFVDKSNGKHEVDEVIKNLRCQVVLEVEV